MSKYIATNFGKAQVIPTSLGDMRLGLNQTLELDDENEEDAEMLECLREWPHVQIEKLDDEDEEDVEDESEPKLERRNLRRRVTKG